MSLNNIGGGAKPPISNGDIIRFGLLKKKKTFRKKWFVLRAETPDTLARLEYYDSEKKFRNNLPPKRSIALKTCFNINKRLDTKYKHAIALYTKDDCFCIAMDTEEEMESWLNDLLTLQHGEEIPDGKTLKPKYEHVWKVYVLDLKLGAEITGSYRLCLTDKTLFLVGFDNYVIELPLSCIRSCALRRNCFLLEVGRWSMLGEGYLWMEAEDNNIAFYIYSTVNHRFTAFKEDTAIKNETKVKDDIQPTSRIRSSSATDSSKPSGLKKYIFAPSVKPHNVYPQDNTHSNSESSVNHPVVSSSTTSSTSTGGGSVRPGTICHQRTQSLPLTSPTTTATIVDNNSSVANHLSFTINNTSTTTTTTISNHQFRSVSVTKRPSQSSKCFRDRCDSMPCRPRTSSEGTHPVPTWGRPYLVPHRPHIRDVSHSPPSGSPISPPSDSTGSCYSLPDENECCTDAEPHRIYNMPLTPDEAIAEEDCPDNTCDVPYSDYMVMGPKSVDDGFQDMPPRCNHKHHSNSASMSSVTSGTPSTDLRLSDYPLDKVASYFTEEDNTRPARAWSVGSKPPGVLNEITDNTTRTRAFSVGAKSKKVCGRVLPPHYPHPGNNKSNSAPILSNSRAQSSYNSIGPMSDLMEMDFTVPRSRTSTNESKNSATHDKPFCNHRNSSCISNKRIPAGFHEVSPYVDMSQGKRNEGYVDMTVGSDISAYMDMSGSASSPIQNSLVTPTQNMVDAARYFARTSSRDLDYVDMDANRRIRTNSKNFSKTATSPGYQWPTPPSDYLDMSGNSRRSARSSFSSQLSSSPNINSISPKSDYMSLGFGHQLPIPECRNQTPDGYVEMTPGHTNRHQRQSSLDASRSTDEYLDMSGGSKKFDKTVLNRDKNKSQPVSIQTTSSNQTVKISSPITISSLLGRKNSTGTPPRMHLPLTSWSNTSPYASLPRQTPRKNSSSKESSTSNSVTTTPSSSSVMFPISLNSPSSPASKTGTPTTKIPQNITNIPYKKPSEEPKKNQDDYAFRDFEPCNKTAEKPKDTSEYVNFCPGTSNKEKLPASLPKLKDGDYSDYAIMQPRVAESGKSMTLPLRKEAVTKPTSSLAAYLSNVELNESKSKGFKPITEIEQRLRSFSPKSADQLPANLAEGDSHQESATQMEVGESPYETLRPGDLVSQPSKPTASNSHKVKSPRSLSSEMPSRPSSVCSEISRLGSNSSVCSASSSSTVVGSSRPESVNSDRASSGTIAANLPNTDRVVQLHYASLDLAQTDDDNSRSPKPIKNSSSEINLNEQPTLLYADIDFVRSEEFNSSNVPNIPSNTKVN